MVPKMSVPGSTSNPKSAIDDEIGPPLEWMKHDRNKVHPVA